MIKKNILIIDSSAVVRRYLLKLLSECGYEVDSSKNTTQALEMIKNKHYSLILLDIEPLESGLVFLKKLMQEKASRVLVLTSVDDESITFEALQIGAIDVIKKPSNPLDIATISNEIIKKVKHSLLYKSSKLKEELIPFKDYNVEVDSSLDMGFVLVGASTGGPRLIEKICKTLPKDYPHCVCIVQHMPVEFTANFAKRLNSISQIEVLEAKNDIELKKSRVIIAKGGYHLHFKKKLNSYAIRLASNINNRFFIPSVDEMFFSANEVLPAKKILAVELTGIGDDGADGMVALRKSGAYTIAESEKSAVVYGMPKEAYERGGAMKVLDFNDILEEILKYEPKN